MLGSGHWNTPNKKLPGVYVQFIPRITSGNVGTNTQNNSMFLADCDRIYLKTSDNKYLTVRTYTMGGTNVRTSIHFRTNRS